MDKIQKTNKRSPNYTLKEKQNLLSIIAKYKNVIDNKRTGAYFIQQKQEAWKSVVIEYNSICTTGPRDENMLKHFYNNIKHRARKYSATKNSNRFLELLSQQEINDTQTSTRNEAVLNNENKTGGGSFTPTLTDVNHQILSVLDTQVHSDENPYDEAAEYSGDTVEENSLPEPEQKPNPPRIHFHRKNNLINKVQKASVSLNRHPVESLRRIYFMKKIELTYYQKKNEMLRFRFEKQKNELEIEILKKQLEKAKQDLA